MTHRRFPQPARPARVAEPSPRRDHRARPRVGHRRRRGEPREEVVVHRGDARHLRLVEHHLRHEHRPAVARRAPRKVVTTVRAVPGGERSDAHRDGRRSTAVRRSTAAPGSASTTMPFFAGAGDAPEADPHAEARRPVSVLSASAPRLPDGVRDVDRAPGPSTRAASTALSSGSGVPAAGSVPTTLPTGHRVARHASSRARPGSPAWPSAAAAATASWVATSGTGDRRLLGHDDAPSTTGERPSAIGLPGGGIGAQARCPAAGRRRPPRRSSPARFFALSDRGRLGARSCPTTSGSGDGGAAHRRA